ncbi:MAG TPA: SMC-Scp complex subunit ScpB [Candidatus Saccharimonadia bacterium]
MANSLALPAQLEAVLFMSSEPLSTQRLAELTEHSDATVEAALQELAAALKPRGLRLSQQSGRYQLVTAPEASALIGRLQAEPAPTELTPAALETLAVVAYQGPATVRQISDYRGVSSDTMVRNLLARGLIEPHGRRRATDAPQYQVSLLFLQQFGLASLADLPVATVPTDTVPEATHAH